MIGVACVGTTTVGRILSELRSCPFFDLDEEIERYFGTSIERLRDRFLTARSFHNEAAKALSTLLTKPQSERAVISLPPSGLMGGYWRVIKKLKGKKVVLTDRPENILARITFYDIDSNPIAKQLTEKEKRLYLREIKKDMTYYKKSYQRADYYIDIDGHDAIKAAQKVKDILSAEYRE